jgi:DNA transformation protein
MDPARTPPSRDFVDHCIELLSSIGRCQARRMFGGWGLSLEGLSIGIVTDLGSGDKLWLKADEDSRARFEAAGCERFAYTMQLRGQPVLRSMGFYTAPEEAMDAADAMAPWARLALASAVAARGAKVSAAAPRKPATARKKRAPAKASPKKSAKL